MIGTTTTNSDIDSDTEIRPFRIEVPDSVLDDLRDRLARTRWPDEIPMLGWEYGVPLPCLQGLADHWRTRFDWRAQEARLNGYPGFMTTIDGQPIHFLHVRSAQPTALPLLMVHGWPGSIAEFLALIDRLVDPVAYGGDATDAFHLVLPGLPGFGFAGPTRETGWHTARTARAYAELMARLGYDRYGVQGGDLGAFVGPELGQVDPEHLLGIHVNAASYGFIPWGEVDDAELATFSDVERARLDKVKRFNDEGSAYFQVHATRPQTIAYALVDSPAGQLAWIVDRMADWVHGPLDEALTRDQILTNVMTYWVTNTAGSAARFYYENMHAQADWTRQPSKVPVGVAAFAEDVAIRRYGEQANNIVHWTDFDRGGHFAAMEAPDLLVGDIREFFRQLRCESGLIEPNGLDNLGRVGIIRVG